MTQRSAAELRCPSAGPGDVLPPTPVGQVAAVLCGAAASRIPGCAQAWGRLRFVHCNSGRNGIISRKTTPISQKASTSASNGGVFLHQPIWASRFFRT